MAKQTESRVNKAFIVPIDVDRPIGDPDGSTQSDAGWQDHFQVMPTQGSTGDDPIQMVDTPPSGRDLLTGLEDPGLIEAERLERWEAQQTERYDSGVDLHTEHSAEIHEAHGAVDLPAIPDEGGLDIHDGFTP